MTLGTHDRVQLGPLLLLTTYGGGIDRPDGQPCLLGSELACAVETHWAHRRLPQPLRSWTPSVWFKIVQSWLPAQSAKECHRTSGWS